MQAHTQLNDLFHLFADQLMPGPHGADPKHSMWQALILFIKQNMDKVQLIADAYIAFMENPSIWGDELALHSLVVMNQIHYCIITKTKVYYSHSTAFPSPSAVHIMLVYLGNSVFWDTTSLS